MFSEGNSIPTGQETRGSQRFLHLIWTLSESRVESHNVDTFRDFERFQHWQCYLRQRELSVA